MRSSTRRLALMTATIAFIVAVLGGSVIAITRSNSGDEVAASLSLSDALNSRDAGFRKVTGPRNFSFPDDHGPHPEYALEWWYFTGNLDTTDGRHFGYELTFFRIGLTSDNVERQSEWAARQMYSAHFALTDVVSDEFYFFERYSRDALGLAGAESEPFRVWLEDWSVASTGDDVLPVRLLAAQEGIEIDLVLDSDKGIVLHGENGFSRKGDRPGEASYYYSMTRMPTQGTINLNGQTHTASGLSWLDREWSSTQLSSDHVGWDWFAIQLSDGHDIMYGVLRPSKEGRPFELGTIVESGGGYTSIEEGDVQLEVLDRWQSPLGGAYPSRWRLQLPREGLDLEVAPYISDQELDTIVRYWEGAVRIEGTSAGKPITGSGYVELTGYAD